MDEFKGVLDWPVEGDVSSEFGPRKDPRYQTEVPHNGLDLKVSPGLNVRAIYPGSVVFADRFEGYGRMVVILHPGRVFSLYAGLGELSTSKGDVVSLGEVVGSASEQVYFEIRRENQPENPRDWLR
jgi:septal ring factor EnvC (AmiA/AmiB activator)